MAVQVSYPGVYIEEFTPGAPIAGVGTSTAAFLGPATAGPMNTPTKLTSWEAFQRRFGSAPVAGSYVWYSVRGFFENGGTVCYFVRVSNGALDRFDLLDGAGNPTVRLTARTTPSTPAVPITAYVTDVSAVNARAFRPTGAVKTASGATIQLNGATAAANAAQFLAGNVIIIDDGTNHESATVVRADNDLLRLTTSLAHAYTAGTVSLTPVVANSTDTIRLIAADNLAAGSVLTFSQLPMAPPAVTDSKVVQSVNVERISPTLTTYRVVLTRPFAQPFDLASTANELTATSQEFSLTVTRGTTSKTYDQLSMDPAHPSYYAAIVNNDPTGLVTAAPFDPPNTATPPDNRPKAIPVANAVTLAGGSADDPTTLQAQNYKDALAISDTVDDINLLCIPDRQDMDVQMAIVAHCENMQDRFGILDSRRGAPSSGTGSVVEQLHGVEGNSGGYAALYYPWILVAPASGSAPLLVPPSGHIAGVYARTDQRRGLFKAPAGTEGGVNGALGVDMVMTDADQGDLNLVGVNVLRVFRPGDRPIVWGARTTATEKNPNWQYVNIRRLFLFLEESIQEGIQWALFEPHNPPLWQKLKRTITGFLTEQWRDGALFGTKPEEAFYVRIDEVLNTDYERSLGRLHIEIGVRPSYPAEFIIVRIGIWQGGSAVSET